MTDRAQGRWMRQQQRAAMRGTSRSVRLPRSSLRDHAERVAEEREEYVAPIGRSPAPEAGGVDFHGIRFVPDDQEGYLYAMNGDQTPRHGSFQGASSTSPVMERLQEQTERAVLEHIELGTILGFDLGSQSGIAAGHDVYAMMYGRGGHRRSAQLRHLDVAERRLSSALGLTAEEVSPVVARFREAMAANPLGDIFDVLRELRGERDTAPEKKKEEPKYRAVDVVSAVRRAVRMDD